MHGSYVADYCRAPRGRLTNRYHGYIIGDKSKTGQDASSQVEMGNPNLRVRSPDTKRILLTTNSAYNSNGDREC